MSCWGNYDIGDEVPNGSCPDCGVDTVDGYALGSCDYSEIACDTCKYQPCDQSC